MPHSLNVLSGQAPFAAISRFPGINANGLRTYRDRRRPSQKQMAIDPDEIETAVAFLMMLTPTKTPRVGSYRLKHVAEHWGRSYGLCGYVSNGVLICAAVRLGLVVMPYPPWWRASPNVVVGVSAKDVKLMIQAPPRTTTGRVTS